MEMRDRVVKRLKRKDYYYTEDGRRLNAQNNGRMEDDENENPGGIG